MRNFWENSGWELGDPHLLALRNMPFQRAMPFMPEKKGLYIIRGPRQVGKSCWLKTILFHYAKKDPQGCYFLSCENITDFREISELLQSLKDRKIIILDEITFVPQWDRAIKSFIDSGSSQILVITGSNTMDIRRGSDRMPGRYGAGGEYELLPMDFFEFTKMRSHAGWQKKSRVDELTSFFHIGGFPTAVFEAGSKMETPKKAIETYKRWLIGDFQQLGRQEVYLNEILGQLALTLSSPISLQKLSQRTQLGSHHTVQEYISTLEDCFALKTYYAIDHNSGAYRFRKAKKFYFRDPLIYWLALDVIAQKKPQNALECVAEMVAAEFLNRKFQRVGYFHSKKGEIDFFKKDEFAIEVKWQNEVYELSKAYLDMIIPNKQVWYKKNFLEL